MGCTSCTDTTPCGTPDCGCKFEVDAGCVRYTGESLGATDIVQGDTLDTILKTLNTKFEDYGPGDYIEVETEAPGGNCTYGGVKIILKDGDDDSVKSTQYICGVNDTATLDGSGTAGTITMWTPDGDSLGDSIMTQSGTVITVGGTLKITGGSPGANKVLKSDADGDASWETISASDVSGVLLQDGSAPLTASWDAGIFNITANTFIGALSGNANTATALNTTRTINGVGFNGTADITVTAAAGTLTGTTLNASVVSSSLTSVGTIATGVWQGSSISTTYTDAKLKTLSGTTNRVSIGGTSTDPIVDISSSYVGQNTITTLGTVGTGTWQGTPIADSYIASTFVKANGTVALSANWAAGSYKITTNELVSTIDSTFNGVKVGMGAGSVAGNTTVGTYTLSSNTTGEKNTATGAFALKFNETGASNTAIGFGTLYSNVSGSYNTAIGASILYDNTGTDNTGVGAFSLRYNTIGTDNTGIGRSSLYSNIDGDENTAIGKTSLYNNTIGGRNTALGMSAGNTITDGITPNTGSNNSIFIGYDTKALTASDTNQIVIGYAAVGNGSNTTTIGNSSTTDIYLHGDLNLKSTSGVQTATTTSNRYLDITISGTTYKLLLAL